MLSLRKLFKFPGPSAFREGVNDFALQSRDFSPETGADVYCWEDYYADLKKAYPIRYFFAETLADFLRYKVWFPVKRPISDAWYYLKCHLVPKHRYHMLDLRQPGYTHGWRDTDTRMLYANFNLLNEFVKYELPNFYCPTEEECADISEIGNRKQRNDYLEVLALHYWWNTQRALDQKKCDDALHAWHERKHKQKTFDEETERLWKEHLLHDEAFDEVETEMLIRLIKIRKSLWT
jgi:hypothetical protein